MSKCEKWTDNPTINPYTGRPIKLEGGTYKRLAGLCKQPFDCSSWREDPLINPISNRRIKKNRATYNMLQELCDEETTSSSDYDADEYDLNRFVEAQDSINERSSESNYEVALSELRAGKKTSHWIWYIFPQFTGLGTSEMSNYFAIRSADEAHAYLHHPILGPRYMECVTALTRLTGKTARQIFYTDDAKVLSSLTLFYYVSPKNGRIHRALTDYFDGKLDSTTVLSLALERDETVQTYVKY